MERAPWFLDPEVLMFGQVLGLAAFVVALVIVLFSFACTRVQRAGYQTAGLPR